MYNNDDQNQAASGQGAFIRRAISNRPVDSKTEGGVAVGSTTGGYQSGSSAYQSGGGSSGYQGSGASGYQSSGASGYQGGSSGGYRSSYNSGGYRGSRDYSSSRGRHDGYGSGGTGGGYSRGGSGGYNGGGASGGYSRGGSGASGGANNTDRLVRQNDLIIKLLKDIRDRLPAPAYRSGSDLSASGSYGADTAAAASTSVGDSAGNSYTAEPSAGSYDSDNASDEAFVVAPESRSADYNPGHDDDNSGNA